MTRTITAALLLLMSIALTGCSLGTYEGRTAEEWFNAYDEADASFRELQSEKKDLENNYWNLKSCIESELGLFKDVVEKRDLNSCLRKY